MRINGSSVARVVTVIAVGAFGLAACAPTSPVASQATTAASATVSPPTSSPTAAAAPPALTGTYTSDSYGFSMSYPAGWVTRPATEPWISPCQYEFCIPDFGTTTGDVIYDPLQGEGNLWIMVASQPLGGKAGAQWVDDVLAELAAADFCAPPIDNVTLDGAHGRQCASMDTAVWAGDRGYLILPYVSGDDPRVGAIHNPAWWQEVLGTIRFTPEAAVD